MARAGHPYAARVLRRVPGFTIAAVLTLALGIGGRLWYQAHLAPGVTLAQASERMTAIAQRRALLHPAEYPPRVRVDVLDLRDRVVGRFVVGLAACLIPARRVARMDPTAALRPD